ncbi:MAG: cytochrome P450 [Bryobacterales bacterium]|nr:cytochrome P450 [Bryobacterales bacterium]
MSPSAPPIVRLDPRVRDPGAAVAAAAAQHGPIFRMPLPNGSFVHVLVGPEANRLVLGTSRDRFSNELGWQRIQRAGQVLGRGLTFLDGAEHALHRKLMAPPFRIDRAGEARGVVERAIARETAGWAAGLQKPVDLFETFYRLTFYVAAEYFLGITEAAQVEEAIAQFHALEKLGTVQMAPAARKAAEQAALARLAAVIRPVLAERRMGEPTGDLLSHLARARCEDGAWLLDDAALEAEAHQLLLAGHISTSSLLTWVSYLLLRHPEYAARVEEEGVLARVMLEAERLYPPIGHFPRVTLEDVEFGGFTLAKGSFVALSAVGGHRLPEVFADPHRFDPERFAPPRSEHERTPFGLIGFSAGPRQCLGIHFAKAEVEQVTRALFTRFQMTLATTSGGRDVECRYQPLATPVGGLPVRVEGK